MQPKKLNLQEITRIYLLLKPAIDGREREAYFLDEITKVIDLSAPEALLECVRILYDNKPEINNVVDFNEYFATGLLENDFYLFVEFIRGFDGSAK